MIISSDLENTLNLDDVIEEKKERLFQGYFAVDRYHLRHKKFDGSFTPVFTREIFERGHAAGMLLFDPDEQCIVLIKQFRAGAYAAGMEPWLLEIPAGIIDKGETPEDVARRETFEETGCEALDLEFISKFIVTPGGSSETIHLFCVRVDSNKCSMIAGLDEECEDIKVIKLPLEDAFSLLGTSYLNNSIIIIALQWLKLNCHIIQEKWC